MAYLVNKTDGTLLTKIFDGQTDSPTSPTGHSSITLIGRQVANYGELQNENFVHLMEHFSNETSPTYPIEGQLWWNKTSNVMSVFDGSSWYPVSGFTTSDSTPLTPRIADQWWDTSNDQFKIYNGTEWLVIGPAYSKLDSKTGALVEAVYDTSLQKHSVIKLYHNGNVTAIISRDAEFTPNVSISGFTSVKPGISFTSSVDAIKYYGTATNADNFGNLAPTQFLRSDIDSTTTANLIVRKHLYLGTNSEMDLSVDTGSISLKNTANNENIYIAANVGGVSVNALTVSGSTGRVLVASSPMLDYEISPKVYVDNGLTNLNDTTVNYIQSNVNTLNNTIQSESATLQGSINATNLNIISNVNTINGSLSAATSNLQSQIDTINNVELPLKAPIDSPVLTGNARSVTPTVNDNSTKIATTAFVATSVGNLSSSVFANTASLQTQISTINNTSLPLKADLDSPTLTGTPRSVTPTTGDSSTKIATTAFVSTSISGFDTTKIYNGSTYVLAGSTNIRLVVSGTDIVTVNSSGMTVATQTQGDNSTKVATTAYVDTATKNYVLNSVAYKPTCYISQSAPNNGVGVDGDLWFQY